MNNIKEIAPVITIDGPSGSGKGTISQILARKLKWNLLDSGVVYRVLAFIAKQCGICTVDEGRLVQLVQQIKLRFVPSSINEPAKVFLDNIDVSEEIRSESIGMFASKLATSFVVREALLEVQRDFRKQPGLVADGRDMGTTVFPNAELKIYLTASCEVRAQRRYNQLLVRGFDVRLSCLIDELQERDERDKNRAVSPLKVARDAVVIDTTCLDIDCVIVEVGRLVTKHLGFGLNLK